MFFLVILFVMFWIVWILVVGYFIRVRVFFCKVWRDIFGFFKGVFKSGFFGIRIFWFEIGIFKLVLILLRRFVIVVFLLKWKLKLFL